jgi:NAD(P)-dependent dehydrogenase (short-subunit alcohol dehydrogenase family)
MLLPSDLLAGRNVFLSGGGSGVNLAIAQACAAAGANVAMCGRNEEKLAKATAALREAHGVLTAHAVADVRDRAAVGRAFAISEEVLGPTDAVICGAAGNFLAPTDRLSTNGFRAVMETDVLGSFHCAAAAFDQLKATRGCLLFVSGGQSQMPFVHQAHVGAAKVGVDQLMRTLAVEWAPLGIRSNSIVPGPVAGTEGMQRLAETVGDGLWSRMVPLGRFADPEEVAQMAAVLVSPLAAYVTGAQVAVDGGMSLTGSASFNQAILAALQEGA